MACKTFEEFAEEFGCGITVERLAQVIITLRDAGKLSGIYWDELDGDNDIAKVDEDTIAAALDDLVEEHDEVPLTIDGIKMLVSRVSNEELRKALEVVAHLLVDNPDEDRNSTTFGIDHGSLVGEFGLCLMIYRY